MPKAKHITTASTRVFAIAELVELILTKVRSDRARRYALQPAIELFALLRVSRLFHDTVLRSKALQHRMFFPRRNPCIYSFAHPQDIACNYGWKVQKAVAAALSRGVYYGSWRHIRLDMDGLTRVCQWPDPQRHLKVYLLRHASEPFEKEPLTWGAAVDLYMEAKQSRRSRWGRLCSGVWKMKMSTPGSLSKSTPHQLSLLEMLRASEDS